jgi:hypothetical protein
MDEVQHRGIVGAAVTLSPFIRLVNGELSGISRERSLDYAVSEKSLSKMPAIAAQVNDRLRAYPSHDFLDPVKSRASL